jgi:intracellular multiplication protein IcmV
MAKKGAMRGLFSSLLNIRKWSSYDEVKVSALAITHSIKDLYGVGRGNAERVESFDAAVQRLQLTEDDIKKRTRSFLYSSLVYFFIALALFAYTIYMMSVSRAIFAIVVCFILILLMLVYSFREHFWYMQMKKRKVGCSFKEWIAFIFGRKTV